MRSARTRSVSPAVVISSPPPLCLPLSEPGTPEVVENEKPQRGQESDVYVPDHRPGNASGFQCGVHPFRQEYGRNGAGDHQRAQLEVDVSQVPVLEGVDDGGAHHQGKASANGVDRWHSEHQQAASDEEAPTHAEETSQHSHDHAKEHQQRRVDDDVGVRKVHRPHLRVDVRVATRPTSGTPRPRMRSATAR